MPGQRPKKPKYTKREKHLLFVIANLRGSACDAWARLNCIVTRRPADRDVLAAVREYANGAEVKEGEDQMRTPLMGAGLPWNQPHLLPLHIAREQEETLDKRSRWSKETLIMSGAPKRKR